MPKSLKGWAPDAVCEWLGSSYMRGISELRAPIHLTHEPKYLGGSRTYWVSGLEPLACMIACIECKLSLIATCIPMQRVVPFDTVIEAVY